MEFRWTQHILYSSFQSDPVFAVAYNYPRKGVGDSSGGKVLAVQMARTNLKKKKKPVHLYMHVISVLGIDRRILGPC